MNSIRRRSVLLSGILFTGAAALAISPLLGGPAHAVTITGSTYASETGGPTPNPTSALYNMTNLSSVSASIRSDVVDSHAESYASASVGANGVTKTTGGLAWVTVTSPANLYDPRGDVWNASATGTTIEATYTGNGTAPGVAPFQFSLPASILATADPFYSKSVAMPGDPASMLLPVSGTGASQTVSQGVIANGIGTPGSSNPLPSFYDVFVTVNANVVMGSTVVAPLFNGSYEFDPSTGMYTPSGDFATNTTVMPELNPDNSGTSAQYSLKFANDILGGTFNAPVGSPFTVDIDTSVSMGDPSNPTAFDFSNSADSGGVIGAGGSVTAAFLLTDPSDFMVSAVPEPSAFYLAAFAAVGLMLGLRRRKERS